MNEYREGAMEIINVFQPKTIYRFGWNSSLNKRIIHEARLQTAVSTPELEKLFNLVKFDIACEDSELTVAADVLVGSLRHHLMSKVKIAGPGKLNSKYAIADHVLQYQMY